MFACVEKLESRIDLGITKGQVLLALTTKKGNRYGQNLNPIFLIKWIFQVYSKVYIARVVSLTPFLTLPRMCTQHATRHFNFRLPGPKSK